MNGAGSKPERSTPKRRKAKGAAILGDNAQIVTTSDPTLYSNGTLRLPRLGADAPNNRHRASVALSESKVADLIEAVEHAEIIGLPLNRTVAIHFEVAALDRSVRGQEAVSTFLRLASQWMRSRGSSFAYIWVLEHATSIREHVHIMCHCPPELAAEFNRKAKTSWMEKAGMLNNRAARKRAKERGNDDSDAIVINRMGLRGFHPDAPENQRAYKNQVDGALRYHLKSLDPEQFPANDDGHCIVTAPNGKTRVIEPEQGGTIYGRRCSRSENISAKARRIHWAMQQPAAA